MCNPNAKRALRTKALPSRAIADKGLAEKIPTAGIRQFLLKNLIRDGYGFAWSIPLDTIAEQYSAITDRFPSARIKTVERTNHWLHVEAPSAVGKLINVFLST